MDDFTPIASTIGGALIGLSAALLMFANGKIAGISGVVGGLFSPANPRDIPWRVAFTAGIIVAGFFGSRIAPEMVTSLDLPSGAFILAGLLVGIGTRVGNGCTSGHGVCGLSRRSPRSLVATVTFIGAGVMTVLITRHLMGAGL